MTNERTSLAVSIALMQRVYALEDAVRRLCDAGYGIADHERAYPAGSQDVVIEARWPTPEDGVYPVKVPHLRELKEAIEQGEEALWPEGFDLDYAEAVSADG